MKLSISIPDSMAREIKSLSVETERNVSWWIQKAWEVARTRLLRRDEDLQRKEKSLTGLSRLRGVLKSDFPKTDSVSLSHQAFQLKKFSG